MGDIHVDFTAHSLTESMVKKMLTSYSCGKKIHFTVHDNNNNTLFDFCLDVPEWLHTKNKTIHANINDIKHLLGYEALNISNSYEYNLLSLRSKNLNTFRFIKRRSYLNSNLKIDMIRLGKMRIDDHASLLSASKLLLASRYDFFSPLNNINTIKLITDKRKGHNKSGVFFEIRDNNELFNRQSIDLGMIFPLTADYALMIVFTAGFYDVCDELINEFLNNIFLTITNNISVNSGLEDAYHMNGPVIDKDEILEFNGIKTIYRKNIKKKLSLQGSSSAPTKEDDEDDFFIEDMDSNPAIDSATIFSNDLIIPEQNFNTFKGRIKVPEIANKEDVFDQELKRQMNDQADTIKKFIKNHCSEGWKSM